MFLYIFNIFGQNYVFIFFRVKYFIGIYNKLGELVVSFFMYSFGYLLIYRLFYVNENLEVC